MSPLPEKRKSAEEIAELRKSLGIDGDGPPPGAPGMRTPAAPLPAPPEEVAEQAPEEAAEHGEGDSSGPPAADLAADAEPVAAEADGEGDESPVGPPVTKLHAPHSLRKSATLAVDRPKAVAARGTGELPSRRHNETELMRLRKAQLPEVTPPVLQLERLTAHGSLLLGFYGAGFVGLGLAVAGVWAASVPVIDLPFDWLARAVREPWYRMALFGVMLAGGAVMLAGAGWIAWRKKRSTHHAAILTILAVLVLVFGTLYFFPQFHGA